MIPEKTDPPTMLRKNSEDLSSLMHAEQTTGPNGSELTHNSKDMNRLTNNQANDVKRHTRGNASVKAPRASISNKVESRLSASNVMEDRGVADQKGGTFVDANAMKEKVREKLSKPKYNVADYYHDTGMCQRIARSGIFDKMTLSVIAFNAVWIAVDTDLNDATLLLEARPPFVIAENFFCLFFSLEWFIRWKAFRHKCDGAKDGWFVFDSFMVAMMVMETWVFTVLILLVMPDGSSGESGNAGVLRLARLLRLSRMARMGKLLRLMPELMIMIKGMKAATRSVFFTLVLLTVIMYIFAIAFVQLSSGSEVGDSYFEGVLESMYTLLIYGIFLDNVGNLTKSLNGNAETALLVLFFVFILIGALTVMNMLVGVLCEVVSAVAATEQEEMLVNYVNEKISRVMAILDSDGGGSISKKEFLEILDNVEAVRCLSDVGVDVFALIDLADYLFEDDNSDNTDELELDFSRFMEVVLQLRGTNQATVKDIVDLRKFMRMSMQENHKLSTTILDKLSEGARISEEMMQKMTTSQCLQGSLADPLFTRLHRPKGMQAGNAPLRSNDADLDGALQTFPTWPRSTPNGQLLSWVPIGMADPPPAADSEELALRGDWMPVDGRCEPRTNSPRIPEECETYMLDPMSDSGRVFQQHSADQELHIDRPSAETRTPSSLKLPRLPVISDRYGNVLSDTELKALQLQFEDICVHLANSLHEAIDLAGRSAERRQALRPQNGLKKDVAQLLEQPLSLDSAGQKDAVEISEHSFFDNDANRSCTL